MQISLLTSACVTTLPAQAVLSPLETLLCLDGTPGALSLAFSFYSLSFMLSPSQETPTGVPTPVPHSA